MIVRWAHGVTDICGSARRVGSDPPPATEPHPEEMDMLVLVVVLLVLWLILVVVGFAVKGLVWLSIIGMILFAVTAASGTIRRRVRRRR